MEKQVNVLVAGEGGREFAVAKKLQESPRVKQVYCAPGNAGMSTVGVVPIAITETDFAKLIQFAKEHNVTWTFVSPEDRLVDEIVDEFKAAGLRVFGPDAWAAQLEGSRDYALNFMNSYHVPTARYATYRDQIAAINNVEQFGFPVVVKENGLAGGKGVVIAKDHAEAIKAIKEMFVNGQARLVIEECLSGPEYSMLVLTSNGHYRVLPMAQSYKRAFDDDKGPNTRGMGAYNPLPQLSSAACQQMIDEVLKPAIDGLMAGEYHCHGILYIGLILTGNGPKVIECNVHLGGPETQVILPRMKTDLFELVDAAINDRPLPEVREDEDACSGVVLTSKGYPIKPIHGQKLGIFPVDPNVTIDYANVTGIINDLKGAGGRLPMVIGKDDSLQKARDHVYGYLRQLDKPERFYRHDIGAKAGLQ